MKRFQFLANLSIDRNLAIVLTVSCLTLAVLSFTVHFLLQKKHFSKVNHIDTLWFFIKKNIFFLLACAFCLGFIASLIMTIKLFI